MQIESLKVFCDLVDTGSFTRSAVINGVTQSAVSQQISALERNFKTVLLERKKGLISLTNKGKILYDNSKKMLVVYSSLIQQMNGSPAGAISTNRMTRASVEYSDTRSIRATEVDEDSDDLKI